jgi:hypothetical protein
MEKQTIEWQKDYVVVRDGTVWKIRRLSDNKTIEGAFTDKFHAEQHIASLNNTRIDKVIKAETNKIKKSGKDIKTRMKEYKELCQQIPEYS